MVNWIYYFIIFMTFGCSAMNKSERTLGSFQIIKKIEKKLDGGIELKINAIYYDSSLAGSVKVILDEKYIYFTDTYGKLNINLSNKTCISLKAYSVGMMVCNIEKLCFDSNLYIQANLNLEWP